MNNSKTMINDLTTGSVTRNLLMFAYPFILSNLFQVLYTMVDMAIVGKVVGNSGQAAVSVGGDMLQLCTFFCMGFAGAGQIMIAQYVGAGDRESIKRTIGTMFTFIMLIGVVLTVISVGMVDTFLRLMSTPAEAYAQARAYSLVCFSGLIFIFGYNVVSSILRGMGDSTRPFIFIAIASVINVILALLFVAVFHMNAFGSALATVIAQATSFACSAIYLYFKRDSFGFDFKPSSFKIDKAILMPMIKLGLPLALQSAAISISMLCINSYVYSYGEVATVVTGIGNKLRGLMAIFAMALATASSAMIGQNMGAGKPDRVKIIVRTTLKICVTFGIGLSVIFLLFPIEIFGVFSKDPAVLAWAPEYMIVCAISFMSFALMAPYNAVINGIGYASLSFVIAMLDGVVTRIGLALLLGITFGMGIKGFWYGNAFAAFTTVILAGIYYYSGRWEHRKLIIGDRAPANGELSPEHAE